MVISKRSAGQRMIALVLAVVLSAAVGCGRADQSDPLRPTLVLYAFDAEGVLLQQQMTDVSVDTALGREIRVGQLGGKPVVLAESGVGMTNAAMTTQAMLDRYRPVAVVFSGIAGGVDSTLNIGDIVVCSTWTTHDYGQYDAEGFYYRGISFFVPADDSIQRVGHVAVDEGLLAAARTLQSDQPSLKKVGERTPQLAFGGRGASGNSFIDNRDKRQWLADSLHARVVDMESAAVVQVCTVNDVPCLVFRSASDLAGGSGSETAHTQMEQFMAIAAENSSRVVMAFLEKL